MRNLTYTLSPHFLSLRSLTPKKGVGRHGLVGVTVAHFNLTPEASYVDGLICYHSCCQVSAEEPDNTNGSKSNHQHKEASGVRLKCAT